MTIRLDINLTPTEYRVTSLDSNFALSGPAICMTTVLNDKPVFLSIAEGEAAFTDDPDFNRMKASGELRIFNPCDILAFEPENAAVVIHSFMNRAQHHFRKRYPSLVREFFELFVDRFVVTIHFPGFDSLPEEAQNGFRRAVRKVPGMKHFEIIV